MTERAAVAVHDLSVTVGSKILVSGVGFTVAAGEIVTLFGPSGAGKTTIGTAIACVPTPGVERSGSVEVQGKPVTTDDGRVGYLPQHAAATLNPARRVGTAITELIELHGTPPKTRRERKAWRRERLRSVLATAAFEVTDDELDRLCRRYPFEFSGGERTRLALAQVLAVSPEVLVLDEPTEGLDSIGRAKFVEQLAKLRADGTAIVLVTHDRFVAERLSDRVLNVRSGELVSTVDEPLDATAAVRADTPTTGSCAVRFQDVSVQHNGSPILRDVRLEVARGESLGIIGVSGAGKSTIARCVAGLVRPNDGTVLINGERLPPLRKRSRRHLAEVQYVWQESAASFEPRRTVLAQVAASGTRLRGMTAEDARTAALELLRSLGIERHQAARFPRGLSGGQLQRAALARALLAEPSVLICDEVTNGLAEPLAGLVLDRIDAYRRETGAAVIAISHDLRAQLGRADRIAVVDASRIVQVGTPDEFAAEPNAPALRALLDAEALATGDLSERRSEHSG